MTTLARATCTVVATGHAGTACHEACACATTETAVRPPIAQRGAIAHPPFVTIDADLTIVHHGIAPGTIVHHPVRGTIVHHPVRGTVRATTAHRTGPGIDRGTTAHGLTTAHQTGRGTAQGTIARPAPPTDRGTVRATIATPEPIPAPEHPDMTALHHHRETTARLAKTHGPGHLEATVRRRPGEIADLAKTHGPGHPEMTERRRHALPGATHAQEDREGTKQTPRPIPARRASPTADGEKTGTNRR